MSFRIILSFLVTIFSLTFSTKTWAWGARGHALICETAPFLVEDLQFKNFLLTHSKKLGHLCNVPDIHWREFEEAFTSRGNPSHYIEAEPLGLTLKTIPRSFDEVLKVAKEKNVEHVAFGSAWWRVEQMAKLATLQAKEIVGLPLPFGRIQEQMKDLPYNQKTFDFMVTIGTMGHFVGDVSQPLHNTADYDGWMRSRGGIHSYYEDACVDWASPELMGEVYEDAKASSMKIFAKGDAWSVTREVSLAAFEEIEMLFKKDKTLKNSEEKIDEKGQKQKSRAERPDPQSHCRVFKDMITKQMARSVRALAYIWEQIYIDAGKPNLSGYKSYRFPFQPDFIDPSYLPKDQVKEKKTK